MQKSMTQAVTPTAHLPAQSDPLPRIGARRTGVRWRVMIALGLALIGLFALRLAAGSVAIPLDEVIGVLLGGEASKTSWTNIVLKVRLPLALTAALAGSALAVGGLMMQTLFRNPLADPYVLGISSGASLGAAVIVLAGGGAFFSTIGLAGDFRLAAASSLGAGAVMTVVLIVSRRVTNSVTLLILGLMFGYMTSAIVSLLLHFAVPERVQAFTSWSFGSFGGVTWGQLRVLIPAVTIGLTGALVMVKPLNALLLGETYARSLGLNVRRARFWIVAVTAVLAGAVTAFCGPIAFLGVAVPHLCRGLLRTADHRALLPAVMIMGANVALVAALIADLPGGRLVLPLNAVMALIGAPVVMAVILRHQSVRG
jgi:iron complex transport system permease protein